jgi:hypothetical protein
VCNLANLAVWTHNRKNQMNLDAVTGAASMSLALRDYRRGVARDCEGPAGECIYDWSDQPHWHNANFAGEFNGFCRSAWRIRPRGSP